ncbi:21716_t:CDS:2, partial [Racocetra persica]
SVIMNAKYILELLDQSAVEKVWNVSRVTSQKINHIVFLLMDGLRLIATRWISRNLRADALKECAYHGQWFNKIPSSLTTDMTEQLFYGKIWGLAYTAVDKCLLHHDYKFVYFIEEYLDKIHKYKEIIMEYETQNHISVNNSNEHQAQNFVENDIANKENIELPI